MMKRCLIAVFICILLTGSRGLTLNAAEIKEGSVTVLFYDGENAVPNARFQVFRVAEAAEGSVRLIPPFLGYPVKLGNNPSDEEWKSAASTLAGYAARDNINPFAKGETGDDGRLVIGGLTEGIYLITGSKVTIGDITFFAQPMLVSIPYLKADGSHDYDIVMEPKYDKQKVTDGKVTRSALKVWKDEGNEDKRPDKITVQLLSDGTVYDEQVLNKENNWSYTWENLDPAHDWQLTEKDVLKDYTVDVTRQGVTFIVTNTDDNPPPPPMTPEEPRLPQTGLLWWPVPVFLVTGAGLLFAGILFILTGKNPRGCRK